LFIAKRKSGVMLFAGGTDVVRAMQRDGMKLQCVVDISHLEKLRHIVVRDDIVRVGALTRISDFKNQNAVENNYKALREVADSFGGPSVANMATVGGNICAASSSADLLPVLLALDASVILRSLWRERTAKIQDFLLKEGKPDLRAGEIVAEVQFEAPKTGMFSEFRKIGRRRSLFMATVSVSAFIDLDLETTKVKRARVAFNALRDRMPGRAELVESALVEKKLERKVIEKAISKLSKEFSAPSDCNASAEYKLEAAKVLLEEQLNHFMEQARGG